MIKYAGFQEKSFHIKGVIEKHMKDQRRKRRNEQHVEDEANFIGDILKLLFALSLAIVAIVVCFLFFKNIAGFSLPNLKATEAASESSKEAVVITEASKETKKKETEVTTEKTTEETTEEETTTKSEETSKEATKESAKESTSKEESSSSKKKESIGEPPTLESQSGKKSSTAAMKESTAPQKSSKSQGPDDAIVGEGPKSAEDSGENQGPGNP